MINQKKIVLVEDNPADVILAEFALESIGVRSELVHFDNGLSLFNFLENSESLENISLILLDLNMPRMNGLDVLRLMRKNQKTSELPVVVFTCSSNASDIKACYQSGANAYVQKPIDLESYDRTMEAIICFWKRTNINVPKYIVT